MLSLKIKRKLNYLQNKEENKLNITFLGAAQSVTGSNFLVETESREKVFSRLWLVSRKSKRRGQKL